MESLTAKYAHWANLGQAGVSAPWDAAHRSHHMTARTSLLAMTGLILGGFTTTHATAGDYGISFQYSSYTPSCYSSYYPRSYAYYDAYRDYREPVVYVGSTTPSMVVYDDCYPTTYRTTYTRSDCYTRPVRHARASVHYRSAGHRTRHYRACKTYRHTSRKTPSYRHDYRTSRCPRVYTSRHSGSHCRLGDSYSRLRSSFQRYRDGHRGSRLRHHRTPRVRIIRR